MLGVPVRLATPAGSGFGRRTLGPESHSFLGDHRVEGAIVVPATAWLEMALAASTQATGELPGGLADVRFLRPWCSPSPAPAGWQVVVVPETRAKALFQISAS